jgi:hypothetical protein
VLLPRQQAKLARGAKDKEHAMSQTPNTAIAVIGIDSKPERGLRGLWRWATTPPQVYVVYVLLLMLVWGVSFLAGTLNPKRTSGQSPPPVSAPPR